MLPIREGLRDYLRQIVPNLSRSLTNGPEEPPLGIEVLRVHCEWFVFLWQPIGNLLMVSSLLHGLRSDTSLEAELGARVGQLTRLVVVLAGDFKVVLDHVDVGVVVLVIYSRVADDANAEFVEAEGQLATFLIPSLAVRAVEEGLHLDDGWLRKVEIEVGLWPLFVGGCGHVGGWLAWSIHLVLLNGLHLFLVGLKGNSERFNNIV